MKIDWKEMPEKDIETIYLDVDGTLIQWPGCVGDGEPWANRTLIARLRAWLDEGDRRLFVWSYGGVAHARKAVEFCGIADIVSGCMGKPTVIIDDDLTWFDRRVARHYPVMFP